jgi:hypothetical protein
MSHSALSMCATRFDAGGVLRFQVAAFDAYECASAADFYPTFELTQWDAVAPLSGRTLPICLSGSLDAAAGISPNLAVSLTATGPCPAAGAGGPGSPGVIDLIETPLAAPYPGNPSTVCVNPPPAPPPRPAAAACARRGTWRVAPLRASCAPARLAYARRACGGGGELRTLRQLGRGMDRAAFELNHSWTRASGATAAGIAALRARNATRLAGPPGGAASELPLRARGLEIKIYPVEESDCEVVNLVAASGPDAGALFSVTRACGGFAWARRDGDAARFRLIRASETGA